MSLKSTESSRLMEPINRALGEDRVNLSSEMQRILDALMKARPDFLLMVSSEGVILFASEACGDLFGIEASALFGRIFHSLIAERDQREFDQFMADRVLPLAGQSFSRIGPLDLRVARNGVTKGASARWISLRVASIDLLQALETHQSLFFFSLMDISHREEVEERILQQLNFDALTGLPSRYNLISQVEKHILSSQTAGVLTPFVFVFFDLDRFKTINDALGHRIGDAFLAALCQRVRDFLDEKHVFGRFGGDEFILFLPTVTDLDEASQISLQALGEMRQPFDVSGYRLSCGASFGLARFPDHGTSVDSLIDAADTAMYHIKSQGIGGCAPYDSSMNVERFSQLELEQELREALVVGDFIAFFQPMVDLRSGEIVGVEALARWRHARLGILAPAGFLALAEQAGLVPEIDALVQRSALEVAATWRLQGYDINVSLNSSSAQFESAGFLAEVEELCAATNFPFERLQIELTEQTLVRQVLRSQANIKGLRDRGVKVGIDDFGMGYSSLSYLHQFPVDSLKIDRTFIYDIQNLNDARVGVSLADAIIAMAKGLNLTVIAEGVEHAAQVDYLRRQGCDVAQGHLFGAACDADEMSKRLAGGGFSGLLTEVFSEPSQ